MTIAARRSRTRYLNKKYEEAIVSDIVDANMLKSAVAKSCKRISLEIVPPPIPLTARKKYDKRPLRNTNQDCSHIIEDRIASHRDDADTLRYVGDKNLMLDYIFFKKSTSEQFCREFFYKPMKDYLEENRYGREANEDIGLDEDQPPMPDSVYENALKLLDDCFRILSWNMDVDPDNGEVVFGSRDCKGNVRLLANNKISFYIKYNNRYLSNEMEFSVCAVDNIITFWEAANDERK